MALLVLIETAGNQDFIFSTNKLKQNIGASELIHRIGTTFVLEAVQRRVPAYRGLIGSKSIADFVRELDQRADANPIGGSVAVEVLVATSGKAVLLVDDAGTGQEIVAEVTRRALEEAPGAVVRGIVDSGDGATLDPDRAGRADAEARMRTIHESVNALRRRLPAPQARFPVLPVSALCQTSGLPAEHTIEHPALAERQSRIEHLSEPAFRKHRAADAGWIRVKAALGKAGDDLARNIDRLEKMGLDWFGVVHADGNGFGTVFRRLVEHMPDDLATFTPHAAATARAYFTFYRKLSLALDLVGATALGEALTVLEPVEIGPGEKFKPLVPMVFGGDDLTVICDGSRAVAFARAYLKAFEAATERPDFDGFRSVIPCLLDRETNKTRRFGGAAGVAVVKPHHPFHRAYDLAADLTGPKGAKMTKGPLGEAVSTIDFQVVYEDAASDLATLRADWRLADGSILHARPYVVSDAGRFDTATEANRRWARRHHVSVLARAVGTLAPDRSTASGILAADERDRAFPRSQQHALRSALFEGRDVADARLSLIVKRYRKVAWNSFGDEQRPEDAVDSLLFAEERPAPADGRAAADDGGTTYRTRFMDALELVDIGETLAAEPSAGPPRQAGAAP